MLRFLAVSLVPTAYAAAARRLSEDSLNVQCDPERCVKASFTFGFSQLECASCDPRSSKWRCPAAEGGNVYSQALEATFPGEGFGAWSLSQCTAHEYTPSFLAFSGPAAYSDHFVPSCPAAEFCACGEVKDKVERLLFDRASLSPREQNDAFWASLAPGFELYQGFTDVTGGSEEHFDLLYHHADGRRQFCSGVNSFTYAPQTRYETRSLTHTPEGYETGCTWGGCDEGYVETSSSFCWIPPVFKETCRVPSALVDASSTPAPSAAADSEAAWTPFGPWSGCSKACGGGERQRRRECIQGSGRHVGTCDYTAATESEACNERECNTYTTGCAYWPSCAAGYERASWEWCSWGKSKNHCRESQTWN